MDSWYDAPRFFIEPEALHDVPIGSSATLRGAEAHHAVRVMRLSVGDAIVLLDGRGYEYYGHVSFVERGRDGAALRVENLQRRKAPTEPPFPVHLVQGLPKGDKFEFVLQKGTEVGVTSFWPVFSDRVVVSYTAKKAAEKHARWTRLATEAAKQARRGIAPGVHHPAPIQDVVSTLAAEGSRILLFWEQASVPLLDVVERWSAEGKRPTETGGMTVIIGPEGGLSQEEVEPLLQLGAEPVSLGPRILRTETAGIIAPALALFSLARL